MRGQGFIMWNLSNIYKSFEAEAFTADMKALESGLEKLNSFVKVEIYTKDDTARKIGRFIGFKNELGDLINKLGCYSYLTLAADVKNALAGQNFNKVLAFERKVSLMERKFQKWLLKIDDIHTIINEAEALKDYEFYLSELIRDGKHMPEEGEAKLFARMKGTGSSSWESLHRMLISKHKIELELDGKKENLALQAVQGMLNSNTPKVRKKAFKSEILSYEKIGDVAAVAYNSIKGEQLIEAELKKYDSVLQMALNRYKLKEETIMPMLNAIKKYAPAIQKGIKHKAKILGYNNSLPFYDLFAPLGGQGKTYTYNEAKEIILSSLRQLGDKIYLVAERAFNEKWIDEEVRENKRNGGFCSNIHSIKESRILFNFTGVSSNISQLCHEIGHAYHHDCLNTQSSINSSSSLAIMEASAIFTENFMLNKILEEADHKDKLGILNQLLIRDIRLILDICAYFNFETKALEIRKERILSQNELCSLLEDAFSESYGDSIDKATINKYAWISLPQLFYSDRPYYMLTYAFGVLFAKGLYAQYIKDKDNFIKSFEYFLTISGKCSIEKAAKKMNIDITSEEFWVNSLNIVDKEINAFIKEK